jgi:hypothetical protein
MLGRWRKGFTTIAGAADLIRPLTEEEAEEFDCLHAAIQGIQLIDDIEDKFSWSWSRLVHTPPNQLMT